MPGAGHFRNMTNREAPAGRSSFKDVTPPSTTRTSLRAQQEPVQASHSSHMPVERKRQSSDNGRSVWLAIKYISAQSHFRCVKTTSSAQTGCPPSMAAKSGCGHRRTICSLSSADVASGRITTLYPISPFSANVSGSMQSPFNPHGASGIHTGISGKRPRYT